MNEHVTECLQNYGAKNYNCAQSVLCAYADEIGLDTELAYRMAESLGGGFGGMQEVCGAFSAACLVLSTYTSDGNLNGGNSKPVTRQAILKAADMFKAEMGSIICRDILGGEKIAHGTCGKRVRIAAEILETLLPELKQETSATADTLR